MIKVRKAIIITVLKANDLNLYDLQSVSAKKDPDVCVQNDPLSGIQDSFGRTIWRHMSHDEALVQ